MDIKFFYLDGPIPFICQTLLKLDTSKVVKSKFIYSSSNNRYEPIDYSKSSYNFLVLDIQAEQLKFYGKKFKLIEKILSDKDNFLHSKTFLNTIQFLHELNFTVLLDYSLEGRFVKSNTIKVLLDEALKVDYNFENVAFVTNNSHHIDTNKLYYGKNTLNVFHFPYWLLQSHLSSVNEDEFSYKDIKKVKKSKLFNIAVRRARLPRLTLLQLLDKHKLLNNSDWSCTSEKIKDLNGKLKKNYENFEAFFNKYDLIDNYRLIAGTDIVDKNSNLNLTKYYFSSTLVSPIPIPVEDDTYNKIFNFKIWCRSKVHIIPETHVISRYVDTNNKGFPAIDVVHLTEKVFKSIRLGMPFVIFGQKNSLHFIKKYGFKTFDKVIDESYDLYDLGVEINTLNPKAHFKSFDTLCSSVIKAGIDLSQKYNSLEVKDVCKYNFNLIRDRLHILLIVEDMFYSKLIKWKENR